MSKQVGYFPSVEMAVNFQTFPIANKDPQIGEVSEYQCHLLIKSVLETYSLA